jgi:hypothetical protein
MIFSLKAFLLAWFFYGPQSTFVGPSTLVGPGVVPLATAGYTGPGDVTSGAAMWWGLRAYSAATRGTKVANVCNASDSTCADISSDPTTGNLVCTSIGGTACSAGTLTVKTLYDQTNGSNCGGGVCDVTNATIANRPVLTPNCINTSFYCLSFTASSSQSLRTAGSYTKSQTFSGSVVAERTAAFTASGSILGANTSGTPQIFFNSAANQVALYSGTVSTAETASDSSFHAFQALFNSTSSILRVDGSSFGSLSVGSTGFATSPVVGGGTNLLTGRFVEAGWWGSDTSTNFATLNSNQHAYWNF